MIKMTKNIFYVFSIVFIMASCSAEKQQQNLKDEQGLTIENRGPIYKTEACKGEANKEAIRKCGDQQLARDITKKMMSVYKTEKNKPKNRKMVVEFYVLENGKTEPINVSTSIGPNFDKAAIDFIKKTRWEPAIHDGETAKIKKRVPLLFEF